METVLRVNDLSISFRTSDGLVRAVRGINFDLKKGETLAIVGESGSGKSVTARAIMGIQAANSVTEAGEIIYDGKDLLKISEEDFHKIRGDRIAMIFQDPMSSLDPIVKIGKQLTEAMILKGKARRRESRASFNAHISYLNNAMISAIAEGDREKSRTLTEDCKAFRTFELKHIELESSYNKAHAAADEAASLIESLAFELEKNAAHDVPYTLKRIARLAKTACHKYVVDGEMPQLLSLSGTLRPLYRKCRAQGDYRGLPETLSEMQAVLKSAAGRSSPDFFAMGYYEAFSKEALPSLPVNELNSYLSDYLNNSFMNGFKEDVKRALEYSAEKTYRGMEKALKALGACGAVFKKETLDKKECATVVKSLYGHIKDSIDMLSPVKDSLSYTFRSSIESELGRYFAAIKRNARAQRAYRRRKLRYERLVKRGKTPDWTLPGPDITDPGVIKDNILRLIERLSEHYTAELAARDTRDYGKETFLYINFLKECASGVVARVTRSAAASKALRLMEEVGIPEPRKRYNQYPFEFSGGMRQRIVIAIALAANPDILICDEPTTALDVTIQAQILELINRLKKERNLSVIFITHDLGVVANMADRVAVMYAGKIVEYGTSQDIFYHAAHPYTWALLSSMPDLDTDERLEAIPGTPPNMIYPPRGDAFAPRNKYAMKIDFEREPPMFRISDTHYAATWLLHPDAPKVELPGAIKDRIERMARLRERQAERNRGSTL